mmetsp:Transcript_6308/g.17231  ORF Transcript_6308/g.17231 Transcript_6308/m.17231 type:complete len:85 (-) Transcript_6308:31-285(-)
MPPLKRGGSRAARLEVEDVQASSRSRRCRPQRATALAGPILRQIQVTMPWRSSLDLIRRMPFQLGWLDRMSLPGGRCACCMCGV